ncbi:hypothetical protein Gorai_019291, partial [Gossypium raimondii]|nr:hypothetical protein [Gossypium raimondii]
MGCMCVFSFETLQEAMDSAYGEGGANYEVFFKVDLFSVEQENEFVFRIKHDFVGSDFK